MEQQLKNLLHISTKLYKLLETIPKGENRDTFIVEVNEMLDERGKYILELQQMKFIMDTNNKMHMTLAELDNAIRGRLDKILLDIKQDMRNLQNSKKNEAQYMNPYANVQVMDGMYYDKKK